MTSEEPGDKPANKPDGEAIRTHALIPYPYSARDGKMDLVNVGASLWRRWKLMLVTFLVCVGAAILIAFLLPYSYEYRTTIEIGTRIAGAQIQPIESPASAAAKLNKGYLPLTMARYAQAHGVNPEKYTFDVVAPEQTNLVIISGSGALMQATHYKAIEKAAAQMLIASDARVIETQQAQLRAQLASAKSKLTQLKNPANKKLLKTQIEGLKSYAAQARHQQLVSSRNKGGGSEGAMTQLLLSTQAREAIQRLSALQAKLNNLPSEIESQEVAVKSLQTQLDNIQPTQIVAGPLRSIEPVGLSRAVIIVIGIIVGVALGFIVVWFSIYINLVQERLDDETSG